MSTPIPYALVYEHFARPLDGRQLEADTWEPRMYAVLTQNGAVAEVDELPAAPLFGSNKGKAVLGEIIRKMLQQLPSGACLVLMAESWIKHVKLSKAAEHDRRKSLEHDPDAIEAIAIMLYGPDGTMRTGHLPIGPDRVVRYAPLAPAPSDVGGRLTPQPDSDVVGAAVAAQDAIRKAQATTTPPPGDPHAK